MGQYHIVVNLDRREYLDPYSFGDGSRLMAFGRAGDGTMTALALLLAANNEGSGGDFVGKTCDLCEGRGYTRVAESSEIAPGCPKCGGAGSEVLAAGQWAGNRIMIVGDYMAAIDGVSTESEQVPQAVIDEFEREGRKFDAQEIIEHSPLWTDISDRVLLILVQNRQLAERFSDKLSGTMFADADFSDPGRNTRYRHRAKALCGMFEGVGIDVKKARKQFEKRLA